MAEAPAAAAPHRSRGHSFAALRHKGYRAYFIGTALAMMADNVEHVISYWVMFQKFHSPALGGFAVVSHWLPYLLFGVRSWRAERPLRLAPHHPAGVILFIVLLAGMGRAFLTGTLRMWHAMAMLVIHGVRGRLWMTSSQVLLHDIVGPEPCRAPCV